MTSKKERMQEYHRTHKAEEKIYEREHKDRRNFLDRKHRAEHHEETLRKDREYRNAHIEYCLAKEQAYRTRNHDRLKIRAAEKRKELRNQVLEHYGNKCVCCGETTNEFLCLDHINGGGNEHRRTLGTHKCGEPFYRWIRKNNYPDILQILCHNCNMSKGFYGECPHERQRREAKDAQPAEV